MQLNTLIGQTIEFRPDGDDEGLDDDRLIGKVLRVEGGDAIVEVTERNDATPKTYRVTASQVTGTGFE